MNREKRLVGVVSLGDLSQAETHRAGDALAGISKNTAQMMAIPRRKKELSRLVHRRPFAAVEDILASNLPGDHVPGQKADSRERENEDPHDWRPSAEISESETEYVVRVGLPGVRVEDMNVRLDGDVLTVRGERRRRENREPERATGVEQCDDCFSSSFSLPRDVHRESVRWEIQGGILTIVLPRKPLEPSSN